MMFGDRLVCLRASFAFDDPMRTAVHRFKYHGEYERGRDLGRRLARRLKDFMPSLAYDAVVPVPLHPRRYRQRGFNQSRILAEEIATFIDVPVVEAVRRVRNTSPQAGLAADARIVNLLDAFEPVDCARSLVDGSRVLVVDDVTTTGATIAAVSDAIECSGASEIHAVTLAREQ